MSENGIRSARGISAKADLPAGLGPKPAGPTWAAGPDEARRVSQTSQTSRPRQVKAGLKRKRAYCHLLFSRRLASPKKICHRSPDPVAISGRTVDAANAVFLCCRIFEKVLLSGHGDNVILLKFTHVRKVPTSDDRLLITYRSPQLMTRGFSNQAQLMKHLFQG